VSVFDDFLARVGEGINNFSIGTGRSRMIPWARTVLGTRHNSWWSREGSPESIDRQRGGGARCCVKFPNPFSLKSGSSPLRV
jgi:hypothetical protein